MIIDKYGKKEFRSCEAEDTLTIAFSGDCCPHQSVEELIRSGLSKDILSDIIPVFESADISIVQFEAPLTNADTPISKSGPNLKCPPECVDFIKAGNFDIALLANNHIGDFGTEPVLETIKLLKDNGIKTVGAGANIQKATESLIFEKNGFNIGIINIAEHEFGTAGIDKPGCAPLEPAENIISIMKLSAETDITIVVIHGGNENNPVPSPRVVRNSRAFADAGANAVINIHTHCPQGIELWNEAPIVYCPGNFFFPWDSSDFNPENFWWTGYIPTLQFDRKGAVSIEITPFTFSPDPWKITPFTGRKKEEFCSYLSKLSSIITSSGELNSYFDAWCCMMGPGHIKAIADYLSISFPLDYEESKVMSEILPLRNRFTCEAHHELIANFLRIVEEGRFSEAEKLIPEIKTLQQFLQ